MTRYWIEFSREQLRDRHVSPNYGVTAYSLEQAIDLLGEFVFAGKPPSPMRVTPNVDVSGLDPKHVLPNIGSPACFGIWYPNYHHATREPDAS